MVRCLLGAREELAQQFVAGRCRLDLACWVVGREQLVQPPPRGLLGRTGSETSPRDRVERDLQCDGMTRLLRTNRGVVGGNVQMVDNVGGVRVNSNHRRRAMQCKENWPVPMGSDNRADRRAAAARSDLGRNGLGRRPGGPVLALPSYRRTDDNLTEERSWPRAR